MQKEPLQALVLEQPGFTEEKSHGVKIFIENGKKTVYTRTGKTDIIEKYENNQRIFGRTDKRTIKTGSAEQ